jgi:hypothetical protein
MGKVTMQGVQAMLHLDVQYPDFATWEEVLDFEVDGVQVQAIATHKWREDIVRIVKPFQIEGDEYGYSWRPPLMALGAAMLGRRSALAARGSSVRDDCIRMATGAYREHAIYLRLKPQIEREQAAFSSQRRDELQRLASEAARAQEHFRAQRLELRRKLQSKEIEPKAYQLSLRSLQEPAQACQGKYHALQARIERGLQEIKMKIIRRALTGTGAAESS